MILPPTDCLKSLKEDIDVLLADAREELKIAEKEVAELERHACSFSEAINLLVEYKKQ